MEVGKATMKSTLEQLLLQQAKLRLSKPTTSSLESFTSPQVVGHSLFPWCRAEINKLCQILNHIPQSNK